ncbi:hypothetical protein AQUCO_02600296v1 [Aquilegia coerulea]|uniref:Ribulose bisphosphate carboxylase small subunit, chloroplastic n=1 Tax=Aquilegia coerulea TaxID=218851 RepID=A0A2G5D8D0_AQUCA|nr:hypothetical protein AQUCO_02600296v1 [Aquilegia coerulea]
MASSMMSSATVASINRATPVQASMVAPFTGLKLISAYPITRKNNDITTITNNGGKVRCMKVWPPNNNQKFETLSYLPPLGPDALAKEIEYLLRNGWVPCLEFDLKGFVYREHGNSPGYYDGRYWTMWKLPMFGCSDSSQVLNELELCKKEYPQAFVRIIGFDNIRQTQCVSFIAAKPAGY